MDNNTLTTIEELLKEVIKVGPHTNALIISALDKSKTNGFQVGQQIYQSIINLSGKANQIIYKPRLFKDPMDDAVYQLMKDKKYNLIFQTDVDCLGHDPVGKTKPYDLKGQKFTNILYYRRAKKEIQAFWFYVNDFKSWTKSINVDYQQLGEESKYIADKLAKTVKVTITTGKNKLEIKLNGKNKPVANYDFTQHLPGGGGNIPVGEVWITPDMTSAEGTITIDGSFYNEITEKTVTVSKPIYLTFSKGKLISITGGPASKTLQRIIDQITNDTKKLTIDKDLKKIYLSNILKIGEFAIGVNRSADFCDDLLIDEKKYGTAHIALGRSYNGDPALYHCDLITRIPEIELTFADGTKEVILNKGEIVNKENNISKIVSTIDDAQKIPQLQKHLVYFDETLVTSHPIKDNGEELVLLRPLFSDNKVQLIYSPPEDLVEIVQEPRLRKTAAKKLLAAAKKLPDGFSFKISEGHRPFSYQQKIFTEIKKEIAEKNPQKNEKEIWDLTTQFVADPDLCPPHTTGGALDITIVDQDGNELDMGNSMNSIDEKSNTFTKDLTTKQQANRRLLFDILTKQGFVNLPTEWWHYSYGDQYWAVFNNKRNAIYGPIKEEK